MKIDKNITSLLRAALQEDIGGGDLTSLLLSGNQTAKADIAFKQKGTLSGIRIAEEVFRLVDPDLRFLPASKEGDFAPEGRVVGYVEGRAKSILAAERTALNFLGHMSGIATLTARFVEQVKGTPAKIYDTRKTAPLLRPFERFAVFCGGGINHRSGLYDGVLVKDNHLRLLSDLHIHKIFESIRKRVPKKILLGIEVKSPEEALTAMECPFDYLMFDHFKPADVHRAVEERNRRNPRLQLEVSGNITLDNVRAYAECGVDRISIGALTHSAPSADVSLDIIRST